MKTTTTLLFVLFSLTVTTVSARVLHCPKPDTDNEKNKSIARRYYKLGLTFQKQGDLRKFIEAYQCVLKLVPYSVTARYKLAEALDAAHQYSKAIVHYTMVLANTTEPNLTKRIKDRIAVIRKLDDKPLPPDDNATKEEIESAKTREKEELAKERERKLAALKATTQQAEEYEKKRRALMEQYRKLEAQKMAELDKKIKRIETLEKLNKSTKTIIKKIHLGPTHRTEHSTIRLWGMGVTAFGLLMGVVAGGVYLYKMQLSTDVKDLSLDEKKNYNDLLTNNGYAIVSDLPTWSNSKAKDPYTTIDMLGFFGNSMGIATGIIIATGAVLFFMGESRKIKIKYDVDVKNDATSKSTLSFSPLVNPHGGGISLETTW